MRELTKDVLIVGGGRPIGRSLLIHQEAMRLADATNKSIHTVRHAMDELSKAAGRMVEEFGTINAKDLIGFNRCELTPSRRGRNIKPDESRKARYSAARK